MSAGEGRWAATNRWKESAAEKRERIAAAVLAGLMANPKFETHCGHGSPCTSPAVVALEMADELLRLLKQRKRSTPGPGPEEVEEEDEPVEPVEEEKS